MKFAIDFKHIVEMKYTAIIEAETKDEARKIFNENPFGSLECEDPTDEQGIEIEIVSVKEMDEIND